MEQKRFIINETILVTCVELRGETLYVELTGERGKFIQRFFQFEFDDYIYYKNRLGAQIPININMPILDTF